MSPVSVGAVASLGLRLRVVFCPDDHDRARGVLHDVVAHGAEHGRSEAPATARADDDQVGVGGCLDQPLARDVLDQEPLDRNVGGRPQRILDCLLQHALRLIGLLEQYATEKLSAKKLILVARTYNPMALRCYTKCGFQEYSREETLIRMSKVLKRME